MQKQGLKLPPETKATNQQKGDFNDFNVELQRHPSVIYLGCGCK
jgi:hypothetical protein